MKFPDDDQAPPYDLDMTAVPLAVVFDDDDVLYLWRGGDDPLGFAERVELLVKVSDRCLDQAAKHGWTPDDEDADDTAEADARYTPTQHDNERLHLAAVLAYLAGWAANATATLLAGGPASSATGSTPGDIDAADARERLAYADRCLTSYGALLAARPR